MHMYAGAGEMRDGRFARMCIPTHVPRNEKCKMHSSVRFYETPFSFHNAYEGKGLCWQPHAPLRHSLTSSLAPFFPTWSKRLKEIANDNKVQ